MSIATICTRGFGSFGAIRFVVTRGYSIGSTPTPPVVTIKPGAGGIDPPKRIRGTIVKPTGLSVRPQRKKPTNEVEARIEQRIDDAIADVPAIVVGEPEQAPALAPMQFRPIAQMSLRDIDAEIGMLLRKKMRTDDEERMLIILLASCL